MKKFIFTALFMSTIFGFIFAQSETKQNIQTAYPSNIIKTNIFKDLRGKINVDYEHPLTDYSSINARVFSNIKAPFKAVLKDYEFINTDYSWSFGINGAPKLFSLGTQLEYRMYSKKKAGPRGFYGAPYFMYSFNQFSLNADYNGNLYGSYRDANADLEANFSTIGGGFLIGAQWLIKNKVTIDWNFFGIGYNWYIGSVKLISDDLEGDMPRMKNDLQEDSSFYAKPAKGDNITVDGNTMTLKGVASMISFRSNISIGFAF